jgi:hypothetical protein
MDLVPTETELSGLRTVPLLSFKSFIQNQTEDLSPEIFQIRYDQYKIDYIEYFSDSFFHQSKAEEWFQDRYNPINIINTEKETLAWAKQEAERFRIFLKSCPKDFILSCSLEPSIRRGTASEIDKIDEKVDNQFRNTPFESGAFICRHYSYLFRLICSIGRHLSGHENRTLYLSSVHACCPKKVLKSAIISALTSNMGKFAINEVTPDRIVISQPSWGSRNVEKFERSAWVVMPTISAATYALEKLKSLEIAVPIRNNGQDTSDLTFSFKLQAAMHVPRLNLHGLPDYLSFSARIHADLHRAELLAELLDEDRQVPNECRISNVLQEEVVRENVKCLVDHLDLIISYLRRVHFTTFYGAKRFRDEAHLLSIAPSVIFRSIPYVGDSAEDSIDYTIPLLDKKANFDFVESDTDKLTDIPEEREIEAPENLAERSDKRISETEFFSCEDFDQVEVKVTTESTESGLIIPDIADPTTRRNIPPGDRRVEYIIRELKRRLRRKLTTTSVDGNEFNDALYSIDESDAKKLEAIQEKTWEKIVQNSSKIELDEKCRCNMPDCGKLFKAMQYLVKHFKSKHEDCAMDELLADAEPFMRKRYQEEDVTERPLPPIEVESSGRYELRSVRQVLENIANLSSKTSSDFQYRYNSDNKRYNDTYGDRYDSNDSIRGRPTYAGKRNRESYPNYPHKKEDGPPEKDSFIAENPANFPLVGGRKVSKYLDVDAPKVCT